MRSRRANRQSRSVGNLGDVLKHAAIVQLASSWARAGATVDYVETHTFLLEAACADPERWRREIDGLVVAHPAYDDYATRERASLERTGRYRCSAGLVLDALGAQRARATLGEIDGVTRETLRAQVAAEGHVHVAIADEAVAALRAATAGAGGATLIHVDPFALTPATWAPLAPGLDALCEGARERASEVALVAYRYTRSAPSSWPTAPRGTIGPVAHVRGGPHEIAAYASPGVADGVRAICASLGWTITPR